MKKPVNLPKNAPEKDIYAVSANLRHISTVFKLKQSKYDTGVYRSLDGEYEVSKFGCHSRSDCLITFASYSKAEVEIFREGFLSACRMAQRTFLNLHQ